MSLFSKDTQKGKYIAFNGKKYALNLERLKEVCLTPSSEYGGKDMIVYDIVKLIIISLLENSNTEVDFQNDFGTVFAINTLLSWGILEEKEE